ncbi:MAG: SoxR reducing system RseC family protein [Candidatus Omnitrophica bacterium]|nr:SoxR reducing system RseC family protein [Candidatus Omnitrophota bacterium]
MREEGKIVDITGKNVVVEVSPKDTCTKCCSCNAAYKRKLVLANDKAKSLKIGDQVEVEVDTASIMKIYLLLYAVPLLLFIITVFMVYFMTMKPVVSVAAGVFAIVISYVAVGTIIKNNKKFYPAICDKRCK